MKSKMKLPHLAATGVSQCGLFHGTPDEATVRCICHQNFDPRMHGRHVTVYGKGVYFSTTAKYSDGYSQNSGRRFMFVARVLVGKSAIGTCSVLHQLIRPDLTAPCSTAASTVPKSRPYLSSSTTTSATLSFSSSTR